MEQDEVRSLLAATEEEITDDEGRVLGVVRTPARFRASRSYLSNGGYLVVEKDEEDSSFVAIEFDALYNYKTGKYYPSGYSARVFKVNELDEAVRLVQAYLTASE